MHDLNKTSMMTPKRYQNPAVFEQLAIEYAVGSLHGRARLRFEGLMKSHFYLQATVDAYENKFANLVELLPEEKPSAKVWENIQTHIKQHAPAEEKTPWWKLDVFKQGFGIAAMALILSSVLFFNPQTDGVASAIAYSAVMESQDSGQPMAVTKIEKSSLKLSIDIMKPMQVSEGMELTLWCHPKKGGKPVKMGTISKSGKTELDISAEEYENLHKVGMLEVSVEKIGDKTVTSPSSQIILKGQLSSVE